MAHRGILTIRAGGNTTIPGRPISGPQTLDISGFQKPKKRNIECNALKKEKVAGVTVGLCAQNGPLGLRHASFPQNEQCQEDKRRPWRAERQE